MTQIVIHNVETGELIEREINPEELKQYELEQKKALAEKTAEAAKAEAKAALLEKLGINEDEAKLLLS